MPSRELAHKEPRAGVSISRREAMGALGALGAVAALAKPALAAAPSCGSATVCGGVRGHMTGAMAAVDALRVEGVRCVFGIPGAQDNELWDAMKSRGLPYLLVSNEFSASAMADAAARATGEVGVFSVVPGPGVTNALTGVGEALLDSVPIVGLVTDVDRSPGAHSFQVHSLNGLALMRPVTKQVIEVQHRSEVPDAIHRAFGLAKSGEPGPVAVVLPYPILTETWDYNGSISAETLVPFDEQAYRRAVGVLSDPRYRVGIYAGAGCAHASDSLLAVAELLQAPVATSVSGKGCIRDSHPLAVGWGYGAQGTRAAEYAFRDVDLVLAVGVKYSEVSTASYSIPCHNPLIHVDANAENLGRNVPATVKVHADSKLFLDRLMADAGAIRRPACPSLPNRIRSYRELDRCENSRVRIACGVDPMIFFVKLREAMGKEELLFVDVTASTHWASEAFSVEAPRRFFTPANNQSMGWAIPASIGAQQVRPECRTVSVTGDGCFLMSAVEISTAARAGLPVKFFVLNDGGYHYMKMLQQPAYRRTTATDLAAIDYAALAKGFGLGYNEIGSNEDIPAGIAKSLSAPGPVLTRVNISYEGREIRWLKAVKASYVDKLSTGQKMRTVSRIAMRSMNRHPMND